VVRLPVPPKAPLESTGAPWMPYLAWTRTLFGWRLLYNGSFCLGQRVLEVVPGVWTILQSSQVGTMLFLALTTELRQSFLTPLGDSVPKCWCLYGNNNHAPDDGNGNQNEGSNRSWIGAIHNRRRIVIHSQN
jgi:hypothetical protein